MNKSVEPKSEKLKQVYKDRTVKDQAELYRDWAQTYDTQTTNEFGWVGFKSAAEAFSKIVFDKHARILDAGCGTGLVGKALANLGYTNLHGRDLSPEMLAMAEQHNIYQSLSYCDLTSPINEDEFDAIICVGVFGFGPPFPEHIKHLVQVTRPSGPVMLTVNGKGWQDKGWEKHLPQTVLQDGLNLVQNSTIAYLENEGISGRLLIFHA